LILLNGWWLLLHLFQHKSEHVTAIVEETRDNKLQLDKRIAQRVFFVQDALTLSVIGGLGLDQ
jgi:hypothetical protein